MNYSELKITQLIELHKAFAECFDPEDGEMNRTIEALLHASDSELESLVNFLENMVTSLNQLSSDPNSTKAFDRIAEAIEGDRRLGPATDFISVMDNKIIIHEPRVWCIQLVMLLYLAIDNDGLPLYDLAGQKGISFNDNIWKLITTFEHY